MFDNLLTPFGPDDKGGLVNSFHLYRMLSEAVVNPAFAAALPKAVEMPAETVESPVSPEWFPPKASLADREMPLRNLKAFRTYSRNGLTGREAYGESLGETDLIDIHTIRRDVRTLREQVAAEYVDEDGVVRTHFIDLLVTRLDGYREGYAYKDASHRASSDIDKIVAAVRAQNRDLLDSFEVRTRATVSKSEAANARLIIRARQLRDEHDVACLQQRLAQVQGWVELPVILDLFGDQSRAFEAAVCLIDDGALLWGGDEYLSPTVFVRPVHSMN
jgi:hypothetical protein